MAIANISGNILTDTGVAISSLATTSSLSNYLPLTGGTLTDTLNGTTANFASSVTGNFFIVSPVAFAAQSGGLRLNSQVAINARNAANSADITLITTNSSDGVAIRNGALNINSSGNVGIGTSSPLTNTQIAGTNGVTDSFGQLFVSSTNTATQDFGGQITLGGFFNGTTNQTAFGAIAGRKENSTANNALGYLSFSTQNGTITERMRITSGGDIAMGATSASAGSRLSVVKSSSDYVLYVDNTNNTTGDKTYRSILGSNTNNTNSFHFSGNAAGGDRIYIYGNGNIVNSNNSYGSLSDVKLKENIVDATPKLDDLLKVKIKNFNYINSQEKQIGVIAQELEEIFPSMIDETEDYEQIEIIDDKGNVTTERKSLGTTTKSVKYSVFVPMLIKAIQELEAKVSALENKS